MTEPADTLAQQILADARKQAGPISKRAQREAEAALQKARDEAERERNQMLQRAERSAELKAHRIGARTELELANIRRQAAERILTDARERAMQELIEASRSPEYPEELQTLTLAALGAMNGERFELVMRAEDREAHGANVARAVQGLAPRVLGRQVELTVSGETIRAAGGVLVRSVDGRQVCDQTFKARLERLWPHLRVEIARDLVPAIPGREQPAEIIANP